MPEVPSGPITEVRRGRSLRTVSGLLGMVINHLKVQDIIDAKAAAILESMEVWDENWMSIYYRDHLADPACHYEPSLLKVPSQDFDVLIDGVDDAFQEIIRGTPSTIIGKLRFVDAMPKYRATAEFPDTNICSSKDTIVSVKSGEIYILIPSGEEVYIYTIQEVTHK